LTPVCKIAGQRVFCSHSSRLANGSERAEKLCCSRKTHVGRY
jgi:hypothetical protein